MTSLGKRQKNRRILNYYITGRKYGGIAKRIKQQIFTTAYNTAHSWLPRRVSQYFTTSRIVTHLFLLILETEDPKNVFCWITTKLFCTIHSPMCAYLCRFSFCILPLCCSLLFLIDSLFLFVIYGSLCSANVRVPESRRLQLDSPLYSIRQEFLPVLCPQMDNEGACKHRRYCSIELQFGLLVVIMAVHLVLPTILPI